MTMKLLHIHFQKAIYMYTKIKLYTFYVLHDTNVLKGAASS